MALARAGSPGAAAGTKAPLEVALQKAERILFLGDSITFAGEYVDHFEIFFRLNYGRPKLDLLALGIWGETVCGLSEPGHAEGRFLRPDLHERLERTLDRLKPDVVFACYGMNDGLYLPYDEGRAAKFREGMQRLHEKVSARGAMIVHLTPPIFDAQQIPQKVSPDGVGGYYAGYDEVLTKYSAWLVAQRKAGWHVIDLHTAMRRATDGKRKEAPAMIFVPDGIHPGPLGHLFMAETIVDELGIDTARANRAGALRYSPEAAELVKRRREVLGRAWLMEIGHRRPDLPKGLPLPEAQTQAAELEKQIAAALKLK